MSDEASPTIRLKLPWEESTFLEGAKILFDYTERHSWRRFLGPIFVVMALLGLLLAIRQGPAGLLFAGTLLSIYWYALRWRQKRRTLSEQFARAELAGKRLKIVADDSGLKVDGSPIPWEAVGVALSTPTGYLLVIDNGFLYFPRSIFSDETQRRDFGNLLAEHTEHFEKFLSQKARLTGR